MSQITVLGFTPSQLQLSSEGANAIHWGILLSPNAQPQSPTATRPKAKSFFSSQRRLSQQENNTDPSNETALFDMHNHQLRQQNFPRRIKSSDSANPPRTTTSISSDIPNKPYTLSLSIVVSTHPQPVSKLAPTFSTLFYRTPTYGPEEDWLRAALDILVASSILEPAASFDADLILAFAGDSVKEYLSQISKGRTQERSVLELDYAKHVREMDSVRAMFTREGQTSTTPQTNPRSAQPTRRSSSKPFSLHTKSTGTDVLIKTHRFLGFTVSPGPNAYSSPRQRWNSGAGEKRAYFERQDDPYGGLM
jgi:hypothetical protein